MRTLHIGLRVADLERSLAFYTGLGYQKLGEVPETAFGSLTMLKLPGDEFVSLELVHEPTGGRVGPGGLNHFVIQVEALHDTIDRLAAQGIDAEPPNSPDGSDDLWPRRRGISRSRTSRTSTPARNGVVTTSSPRWPTSTWQGWDGASTCSPSMLCANGTSKGMPPRDRRLGKSRQRKLVRQGR
jgi:lactoylglutathione lyase